jgi:hypothetical protein
MQLKYRDKNYSLAFEIVRFLKHNPVLAIWSDTFSVIRFKISLQNHNVLINSYNIVGNRLYYLS